MNGRGTRPVRLPSTPSECVFRRRGEFFLEIYILLRRFSGVRKTAEQKYTAAITKRVPV